MEGRSHIFEQPAREYIAPPNVPSDVIDSELRTGGSGLVLRENIMLGLGAIYNHTSLAQSIHEYASMLDVARQYEASEANRLFLATGDLREEAFYNGALLAIHAEVSLDSSRLRRIILASKARALPITKEAPGQSEYRRVEELLTYARLHYDWLDAQPDDLQHVIIDAAEQAYDTPGHPIAEACQREMIFGCTYTMNLIEHLRRAFQLSQ